MAITYDPTTADPGRMEKVPAEHVVIDLNVRQDVRLDKSFISSVRVQGFIQPPVGFTDENAHVHVTVGQRRVSAALEIGWPVIPSLIKPKAAAEADRADELRILTQIAENEQRASLTPAELAAGYKQLALLGVTEDQIARKTNSAKQRVHTALKVTDSTAALAAAEKRQLTLDQAAVIAEFDGDEDAVARLDKVAEESPEKLQHEAERIRNDRLDAEVRARLEQQVIDAGASTTRMSDQVLISELWRADDDTRSRLTLAKAKKYTGLIGVVHRDGWRSPTGEDRGFQIVWYLTGWKEQGLVTWGTRVPLTEKEKEARRQKRADRADMVAATAVRRTWLTEVLLADGHKLDTDSVLRWINRELWHAPGTLRPSTGADRTLILQLAGTPAENRYRSGKDPDSGEALYGEQLFLRDLIASTRDPLRLALTFAIGQTESVVGNPKADGFGQDPRAAGYLRQLEAWGYTLSDVEQRIIRKGRKK